MRKLFILILLVVAIKGYGQEIGGIKIENITSEYMTLTGFMKKDKTVMIVDYGQTISIMNPKNGKIKINGKVIKFKSPMDEVDYILKYGYELVNLSTSHINGIMTFTYLVKKTNYENK